MFSSFPALLLSQGPGARQKLHPLLISPCPFAGRSSSCTNYTTTLPSTFAHFLSMTELHISEILQYLCCLFFFFFCKASCNVPKGLWQVLSSQNYGFISHFRVCSSSEKAINENGNPFLHKSNVAQTAI